MCNDSLEGIRCETAGRDSLRLAVERYTSVLLIYSVSSALVISAALTGSSVLGRRVHPFQQVSAVRSQERPIAALAAWDGVWFSDIVRHGYCRHGEMWPTANFFPAYPLVGLTLSRITGLSAEWSLVLVSNVCFLASLLILKSYLSARTAGRNQEVTLLTLLFLSLWPTGLFFRVAYSESLFLLLLVGAMYGMQRNWTPIAIAVVIGAATGTRAVGCALVPVFMYWLWDTGKLQSSLSRSVGVCACSCWGLLGVVGYQYAMMGESFGFVSSQMAWQPRRIPEIGPYAVILLTGAPIWTVYDSSSAAYWKLGDLENNPLFSLQFANPILFCTAVILLAIGTQRRWLDRREQLLACFLLAIPYVVSSYSSMMCSHGRYAAVVFPIYIVIAHVFARLPSGITMMALITSGSMLAMYAALFASWHRVF